MRNIKKITKVNKGGSFVTKAGSVVASNKDYKLEMGNKLRERIQRQADYKKVFLSRLYRGEELKELDRQIKSGLIKVEWRGMVMPLSILNVEHDIVLSDYKQLITQENYLKQALTNDGLSEKELNEVLRGKYKKDEEELKETK